MCEYGAIVREGAICAGESLCVCTLCVYVCVFKLRAPGTSCPLTDSPTVGRARSIGPEQCQKRL